MKTRFLIILLLLIATIGFSQVNFKPGYIVLTSGDTLFTKIKYLPYNQMYEDLIYLDSIGEEQKMKIKNVQMYKRDTVEYFKLEPIANKEVYYRLVIKGGISLYDYKTKSKITFPDLYYNNSYTIGTGSNVHLNVNQNEMNTYNLSKTAYIEDKLSPDGLIYILKKDHYISEPVTYNNFLSILGACIVDEPELFQKLQENSDFRSIQSIINEYNRKHPIK